MKKVLYILLLLHFPLVLVAQTTKNLENRVVSVIDSSTVDNMVLKQSFIVNVDLESVWNAYTTKKGWESWATAIAEIDFKINGIIKTNYNKAGKIGNGLLGFLSTGSNLAMLNNVFFANLGDFLQGFINSRNTLEWFKGIG